MADVYQRAFITIAAAAAENCHQGFLAPRESSVYLPAPDQTGEPLDTPDSG
jgi:hypothetical protein